ncbi:MAG: arabinose efflux permease [uncultured archaeon A07HR60]|nr:MAG: arabinose efflux permease [uncultured archaeon A07HR60]
MFRLLFGEDATVVRDRSFQLLVLANVLPPLGTALMSPILGSLIDPLGASPASIGLIISAFTAPAVVMIPIAGGIADRAGRKPVILTGLVCFGLGGTAIALTTDFRVVLGLRLLQGIGFAALTPIIITSIGDLYTGSAQATAQGLRFTGSGLTQTVFPLAGGVLVGLAWQYPFLLHAVAFPVAAVVYVWFDEPAPADSAGAGRSLSAQVRAIWGLVTQRRAAAMVIARGTPNIAWIGFLTYNSIVVVDILGGTPAQAGLLAALGSLSYAASATQAGRISAVFDSQLSPLIVANVALAGGTSAIFLARSLTAAYAGVVVMGAGFGVVLSLYRSIISEMAPDDLRGGLVSLGEGNGRAASTITPALLGGAIALGTPVVGFESAVQSAGVGLSVLAAAVGIGCLVVLHTAPPIRTDN